MARISDFFSDMFRHWIGKMTGLMSILLSIAPLMFPDWFLGTQGILHQKSIYWIASAVCFLVASYSAWDEAKSKNDESKARLILNTPSCLNVYDRAKNAHMFFVSIEIGNAGAATAVKNWRGKYLLGDSIENMTGFYLLDSYSISIAGGEEIIFRQPHLIQTILTNVTLGPKDMRCGRLLLSVPGDRSEQVRGCQYKILVECEDFDGNVCSHIYTPHPRLLDVITYYPNEDPPRRSNQSVPMNNPNVV